SNEMAAVAPAEAAAAATTRAIAAVDSVAAVAAGLEPPPSSPLPLISAPRASVHISYNGTPMGAGGAGSGGFTTYSTGGGVTSIGQDVTPPWTLGMTMAG
ncbi:hypothetical protein Vretimale_6333, partial [Volvox reticuliferus]